MPVSVADLAKYYADAPPPKNDTLADLEARLEALISPEYRSPFKFEQSSVSPLVAGAFGTTKYGTLGTYTSIPNAPKLSTVPDVASLFPLHHTVLSTKSWATPLSGLITFGNFPYETGDFFRKTLEKWGIRSLEETVQRWIDALGSSQPAELYPLELAAYEALGHLMAGRNEKVERFLRHWLRIAEPDVETYEAMMRVLNRQFERPLSALENPAAWLRQAVRRERAGILSERDQADTYSQRLAEERAAEEDVYHEPGKTFYLPPRTTYVATPVDKPDPFGRPRNTGMRPPSAEDPYLLVPNKHGSWRQAVEELADAGRRPTQERARLTLEYRQELEDREVAFSRKEFLRRIGGIDAERALKEAAQTRHKRILGIRMKLSTFLSETPVSRAGTTTREVMHGACGGGPDVQAARSRPGERRARSLRKDGRPRHPTGPAERIARSGGKRLPSVGGHRPGRRRHAARRAGPPSPHLLGVTARRRNPTRPPPSRAGP